MISPYPHVFLILVVWITFIECYSMVRHHDKHFTCLFSYTLRIFKGSFTIPISQKLRLTKIPQKKTFPVCGHLHSLPFQLDILVWPGHATGKILNNETENILTITFLFLKAQKSLQILIF